MTDLLGCPQNVGIIFLI